MKKEGIMAFSILTIILLNLSFVSAITFYSQLYKGKTYSNEELVSMGKQMSERPDVIEAISQANDRCEIKTTKCESWMDESTCSDYLKSKEEDRLADCDYAMLSGAARAAYTISLRPRQVLYSTDENTATPIATSRFSVGTSFMSGFSDTVSGALGQLLNFIKNIFGR